MKLRTADLESAFLQAWELMYPTLPAPVRQYVFHPTRKWRFDFAFPAVKIAIEVNGGAYIRGGGRHNRAAGQSADYEKQRAAVALGWRVMPFNTKDMSHPSACAEEVAELMCGVQPIGAPA